MTIKITNSTAMNRYVLPLLNSISIISILIACIFLGLRFLGHIEDNSIASTIPGWGIAVLITSLIIRVKILRRAEIANIIRDTSDRQLTESLIGQARRSPANIASNFVLYTVMAMLVLTATIMVLLGLALQ